MAKFILLFSFFSQLSFSKTLFFIHYFDKNLWTLGIEKGVIDELSKSFSDIKKISFHMKEKKIHEILTEIKKTSPDVVILNDDGASDNFVSEVQKLNIPIFCVGITEDPEKIWWNKKDNKITAIFQRAQFLEAFSVLEKMFSVKNIGILGGNSFATRNLAKKAEKELKQKYQVTLHIEKYIKNWTLRLTELSKKNDALIVFLPFDVYTDQEKLVSWDGVGKIISNINKPIVGLSKTKKNDPIKRLLSHSICPEKQGMQLASLIFYYFKTGKMPPSENFIFKEIQINASELKRLNVKITNDLIGIVSLE